MPEGQSGENQSGVSQAELEQRLAEQARALDAAQSELFRTRRMDAVSQLTGGIAHEFNNLLMAVSGNLQLLLRRMPNDDPSRKYAVNALSAVDRGAKLTGQLLAFSRKQRLEKRPTELDKALGSARELLGNSLGPGVEVRMELGAADRWALLDPAQLELAILNLALNAREAMPGGGVLTVRSRTVRQALPGDSAPGELLSVWVSDTGRGMEPAVIEKATEPFFTTKEAGGGAGLGLAQVDSFVRQMGGHLRIESTPGAGATVQMLFRPAASGAVSSGPPVAADGAAGGRADPGRARRRVLVIDDDASVRHVIVDALRGAGYEVAEAEDGAGGLALLETMRPDAAIVDFAMPGMDGAEVGRRARLLHPALPLIFVSGYFDTAALEAVPDVTVLRKPVTLEGLQRAVSSVLA